MRFTVERINRLLSEISGYIYPKSENILKFNMLECGYKCHTIPAVDDSRLVDFHMGERWGGREKHYWFKTSAVIPQDYIGKKVVLEVKTGLEGDWDATNPQFIAYVNGKLIQGLDVNHRQIILSENAIGGETLDIALHAYAGMKEAKAELNCSISVLDVNVEKLYYHIKVPLDVAVLLDKEDKIRIDILNHLENAVNLIDLRIPFSAEYDLSVINAINYMEKDFYEKFCGHENIIAHCVGHTHIDVAWLWTLAQTREKSARSFSTVLSLMKQYPEYIFMSSQPQLYKYVKEDFPDIYEQIKEMVKEGRWEAEGAMWLEADCNLSSGESLVRQILFGTKFFKEEFGVENKILWLPDVFGYSAALPQILKKSGIDYFMTTKISWNEYNMIPYDTFNWRGIDGTEIFTHFITTSDPNFTLNQHVTTYNGNLVPAQVIGSWSRYQQKDINNEVLISYGYGDGGGGPTKEMLENARRMEKGIPGCPKVKLGNSLDFFKNLEKKTAGNKKLPKWVGELYLEYHRGTYTSMARNKKANRKSEFMYQDAELFNIMNTELVGGTYPTKEINSGWETILLNQFHDILPGSSIKEVYEDSKEQYLAIAEKGSTIINTALDSIASKVSLDSTSVIVFNQLGFMRSEIAEVTLPEGRNGAIVYDNEGNQLLSQIVLSSEEVCHCDSACATSSSQSQAKLLFYATNIPAKGYKAFTLRNESCLGESGIGESCIDKGCIDLNSTDVSCQADFVRVIEISDDNKNLESIYYSITFDDNFNIVSLYDKSASRQVLKAGERANVLQAYEDKPHNFDAWDINIYYNEKMWEVNDVQSVKLLENGPVRAKLEIKRKFLNSSITQEICLYSCIAKIDIVNKIDWKEKQILLKAAFPMDVHTDKATYEIQYGNVERPTHWNTSWDAAKFEVCAHKWADISEDDYGVSLLNDCKYGHSIKDSVMSLTLLKCATEPNVDADKEYHEFTYSLYPHKGDWKTADTIGMAYSLNCPLYSKVENAHAGSLASQLSLISLDKSNVIVEVVKKAEDGNGTIIRLYECHNRRTTTKATLFKSLTSICECDMMENNLADIGFEENCFEFDIKPYEIKTFRLM